MNPSSRRDAIKKMAAGTLILATASTSSLYSAGAESAKLKGRINHGVCYAPYSFLSLDELCITIKKMGFNNIDLVKPQGWATLKKHNVNCSMCITGGIISLDEGWNRKENHQWLTDDFTTLIPMVAEAGYKNLICFSGSRAKVDDETGLKNCTEGLKKIMSLAEKNNVTLQMELLNSKIDHAGYMADRSAWGIELCKRIGSPNFKLLYDIYHMQISEGDIIRTIKESHRFFGHYHTAGVPGRNEINKTQELYYPAIMKAIADTGFKGYVAQEFSPTGKTNKEKIKALKEAITICDV